jgi:hypothetical protein
VQRWRIETSNPKGTVTVFFQISALTNMLDLSSEDHSSASAANRRSSSSSTNGARLMQ